MRGARVFTIPPGVDLLATFARALLDGGIVPGLSRDSDPLAFARATIYVPTRRSRAALVEALRRAIGGPAAILPRILPLGAMEASEAPYLEESADDAAPDLPRAVGEVERRLLLADLVLKWAEGVKHAIVSIDEHGNRSHDHNETLIVATTPADAWSLAGDLAGLIDELIIEDVAWKSVTDAGAGEFDPFWRITTDFLDVAIKQWPQILGERGFVDRAARQVAFAEREIARLRSGAGSGPIIALGSTGTNKATARLLAAIAHHPQGAVMLPGLDRELDDEAWAEIADARPDRAESGFGHPQAALKRLMPVLGIARRDVEELGTPERPLTARTRLVAEALRPADTTDHWREFQSTFSASFAPALDGVTLVEAAHEGEEALALAICMREALEVPDATCALITPDRDLARRVGAELKRWKLHVDDSGGEPLGRTAYGTFARLVLAAARDDDRAALVALINHPLAGFGLRRHEVTQCAAALEVGVLRAGLPQMSDVEALLATAKRAASNRHAHPAAKRISPAQWSAIENLMRRIAEALAPLRKQDTRADLPWWIAMHSAVLDGMRLKESVGPGEDETALQTLFDEFAAAPAPKMRFDLESYSAFFDRITQERILRGPARLHPRLQILGLLEARLLNAELVLLGGLDETIWPPAANTDAFLNRPMRQALGLTPPERRIGQTAHDFTMAMGARKVVISRALKRGGAPTIPSRFLQRLEALAGDEIAACRERGARLIALARRIDCPAAINKIPRPEPRPPIALRPTRLSVTRIETLRRDPYSIYVESVLRLKPLEPLNFEPGARERGTHMHKALEEFAKAHRIGALPRNARERLVALLREKLTDFDHDADFQAFDWPRIEKAVGFYLGYESERRPLLQSILVEQRGELKIPLVDGSAFTLSAVADRIEIAQGGSLRVVDYKTGTPPGLEEVRVGFAPQLTLEAAMVAEGAFAEIGAREVNEALYLKLGGGDGGKRIQLDWSRGKKKEEFVDVVARHRSELVGLLNQFRSQETPYIPRPFPKYASKYSDYDHLARVKEWSATGGTTDEIV
ncbi:MAG: ATP-dependent helicase/nuclease subunit [Methylobacteriaceae bacterium]|nr:ATP-dependent helicase/nuclease subunit [Methylobacteriaceae bacterium]